MAEPYLNDAVLRAGYVQFDVERGNVAGNLRKALRGLKRLADAGVRLAVLPEMWTSSLINTDVDRLVAESESAVQEIRRFARNHTMTVVGSSYEHARGRVYNTAYVIDADGAISGQYRKIHLFTPGGEHLHYHSGRTPLIASTSVGRLGIVICYDLRFPELLRTLCERGAEVLIIPSQWPRARLDHWRTLLRARAIENQVFVIGCNRTGTEVRGDVTLEYGGGSAIIDPWGEVLCERLSRSGADWADLDRAVMNDVRRRIPVWTDRVPQTYKLKP